MGKTVQVPALPWVIRAQDDPANRASATPNESYDAKVSKYVEDKCRITLAILLEPYWGTIPPDTRELLIMELATRVDTDSSLGSDGKPRMIKNKIAEHLKICLCEALEEWGDVGQDDSDEEEVSVGREASVSDGGSAGEKH